MTDTELQAIALKKYYKVVMGNGSESRTVRLYNIHNLFNKPDLTDADRTQLRHFVMATKAEIENTAYVANTVVSPMSWGHSTTILKRKE